MLEKDVKTLEVVFKQLADFELAIASLYRTCGERWAADREFWSLMEESEKKHAQNIHRMRNILLQRPQSFEMKRPVNPAAIRTSIAGIRGQMERIKSRELSEEKMLYIGRDLEQSILERNYMEITRSSDTEYELLLKEVLVDTLAHRESLDQKITEIAA
jgi:hypothetical protein